MVSLFACALVRLSRVSGLHPRCFALPELQKLGQQVAARGFGDIWKGIVRGQTVSVKMMRIFKDSQVEPALKEFSREALIWRQLCHPNLLPFFGLYHLDNRLCLVSPWMENGNIMEFLAKDPILDVALGLQYLLKNKVVHGDLKALNMLVTPSGRACIADFGVSSIVNVMTMQFAHSTAMHKQNHFGSDIYAFGCVCYEIMEGKVPFHEWSNDATVIYKVLEGNRPLRPMSCSGTTTVDSLWELMQKCWQQQVEMRPSASRIVQRLGLPKVENFHSKGSMPN
ncbi:kinase-like domain-containing protein [Mycena capillaripes]|nr:kinase-like domain-containing protein [Mycena capillaripes]